MPMGVLTESKIEILPKIVATLSKMPIEIFELTEIEVDADNVDENKAIKLTRIDEVGKIEEQTVALTEHDDEIGAEGASSIAKQVTISLVDEVVDTSIVIS